MKRLEQLEKLLLEVGDQAISLSDRLDLFRDEHAIISPAMFQAYDRLVERIVIALTDNSDPGIGDQFPDFILSDELGALTTLQDVLRDGPAVISFNRGHWCHYCRLELRAFAEIYSQIKAMGASAVCIVPDRQKYSKALKADCKLPFPVLSDIDHSLAAQLGLVVFVGDELRRLYLEIGFDLVDFQGNDGWFLPVPASYLVDSCGTIRSKITLPDFRRRANPARLLEVLSPMDPKSPH